MPRFGLILSSPLHLRWTNILLRKLQRIHEPEEAARHLQWLDEVSHSNSRLATLVHDHVVHAKPLSYCIGEQPFNDLSLLIRPPVLIPRPETEAWIASLAKELSSNLEPGKTLSILEIGSGSGCIALHLSAALPLQSAEIHSFDFSDAAVKLSNVNKIRNLPHLRNPVHFHRYNLFQSDLVENLLRKDGSPFDLIVSNPPYIPPSQYETLEQSVKKWEAQSALIGSIDNLDGLDYYRKIAQLSFSLLSDQKNGRKSPKIVLEIGWDQACSVKEIFEDCGRAVVEKDVFGQDRVLKVY